MQQTGLPGILPTRFCATAPILTVACADATTDNVKPNASTNTVTNASINTTTHAGTTADAAASTNTDDGLFDRIALVQCHRIGEYGSDVDYKCAPVVQRKCTAIDSSGECTAVAGRADHIFVCYVGEQSASANDNAANRNSRVFHNDAAFIAPQWLFSVIDSRGHCRILAL